MGETVRTLLQSAFARLTIVFAVALLASVVAIAGIMFLLVEAHLLELNRRSVAAEIQRIVRAQTLNDIQSVLKLAVVEARDDPNGSFIYFLADAEGRCAVPSAADVDRCAVGTLSAWPELSPTGEGWVEGDIALADGTEIPVIAKTAALRADNRLFVGRSVEADRRLSSAVLAALGVGVAATILPGLLMGALVSQRFLRKVQTIRSTCLRFGSDAVHVRVPAMPGRDEFTAIGETVNAMLDRIEALMHALHAFSDQVAHDLRTPLGRIRLKLAAVARDQAEEVDARILASIAEIDRSIATFEALLEIARIEADVRRPGTPIALDAIVADVLETFHALADEAGIALQADLAPASIVGDGVQLAQALVNILENALKFTPRGGSVRVRLQQVDEGVRLSVEDNGPGIPEAEREAVVARFSRGSTAARFPGFGLGLSLVRAVAERHGFALRLEDASPGLRVVLESKGAGEGTSVAISSLQAHEGVRFPRMDLKRLVRA